MNDSFLTAEIESLIQGYVEGELTASECARLRELLEASPGLVTSVLMSLQMDALIRRTALQSATAGLASGDAIPHGEEKAVQWAKSRRHVRLAVRIALAACLMVLAALATIFFNRRPSQSMVSPAFHSTETGSVLYEYWNGIPGVTVADLTSHSNFQRTPTRREFLPNFEAPSNQGENYGARVRGYLHPPVTGDYVFWIASDDAAELWLSAGENPSNKQRVCFVESWAPPREWTWRPSQQSQPIRLEAGRRYYIEALHKQGGAGDFLAVAWQAPGGVREIIPGRVLSPASQTSAAP
jgi:hypothetical protein